LKAVAEEARNITSIGLVPRGEVRRNMARSRYAVVAAALWEGG
jgi:hypothetical protein